MGEIRGKDVTVTKFFQARCRLPGCGWKGGEHATHGAASAERQTHINGHRLAEQDTGDAQA
jgi:hypothetical protein